MGSPDAWMCCKGVLAGSRRKNFQDSRAEAYRDGILSSRRLMEWPADLSFVAVVCRARAMGGCNGHSGQLRIRPKRSGRVMGAMVRHGTLRVFSSTSQGLASMTVLRKSW